MHADLRGAPRRAASRASRSRSRRRSRVRSSAPSCSSARRLRAARLARRRRPRPGRRARRAGRARGGAHVDPPLRRPRRGARATTVSVFIESFAPPPRMIIFGAVDFTAALAKVAQGARLPGDGLRRPGGVRDRRRGSRWPTRSSTTGPTATSRRSATTLGPRDAVCVLTHDPKFDVPAIVGALRDRGRVPRRDGLAPHARGSGWSACARRASTTPSLARVMAPIGLDIGARTPEETAVAICAEIIAVAHRARAASSLRDSAGPIHQ